MLASFHIISNLVFGMPLYSKLPWLQRAFNKIDAFLLPLEPRNNPLLLTAGRGILRICDILSGFFLVRALIKLFGSRLSFWALTNYTVFFVMALYFVGGVRTWMYLDEAPMKSLPGDRWWTRVLNFFRRGRG